MKGKNTEKTELENLGPCPLCERDMIKGWRVDEHHLVPKCKKGKVTELMHQVCHQKIHSLFTETELEHTYNTVEALLTHPEILKFISWVKKKPLDYYDSHYDSNMRSRKRKKRRKTK